MPSRTVLLVALALASTSCAPVLASLAIGYERGRANVLALKDDDGIAYLERKAKRGHERAVVVMLHSLGGNKDHWPRFIAEMPDDFRFLAVDIPGFGDSPKDPAASYDLHSQVPRLARFLAVHGVTRAHFVGNSMGAELGVIYALAHPEQVQSLVLFDPPGIDPATEHPIVVKVPADFDRLVDAAMAHPPEIPGILHDYFAEQAVADGPFTDKVMADIRAKDGSVAADLPKLVPPTLVVFGGKDRIIDASVLPVWRDGVPGHTLVVMSDTGHAPHVERAGECVELVLTWWSRVHVL